MAGEKIYDQIRACGIFFISIVILLIVPLVYHCFVFLIAVPLLEVQPFSAWCLLICFHLLLGMVLLCYHRVIFTDAGGVPYELDEAWISELSLASRFGLEAGLADKGVMISDKHSEKNPLTGLGQERKGDGRQRFCRKCHKFKPDRCVQQCFVFVLRALMPDLQGASLQVLWTLRSEDGTRRVLPTLNTCDLLSRTIIVPGSTIASAFETTSSSCGSVCTPLLRLAMFASICSLAWCQ